MEALPRKKLSKMEGNSLIEQYFSSGELPSVFYNRVGLSEGQFYKLRRRYLRDHPQVAKRLGITIREDGCVVRPQHRKQESRTKTDSNISGFARIEVSGLTASTTPSVASSNLTPVYELCYPNGVVLRLPAGIAVSSLSELIKLY